MAESPENPHSTATGSGCGDGAFPTCGDPEASRNTNSTHATKTSTWRHWEKGGHRVRCHLWAVGGRRGAKGRDGPRGHPKEHQRWVPQVWARDPVPGQGASCSRWLQLDQSPFLSTRTGTRWGWQREQHLLLAAPHPQERLGIEGTPRALRMPKPSVAPQHRSRHPEHSPAFAAALRAAADAAPGKMPPGKAPPGSRPAAPERGEGAG